MSIAPFLLYMCYARIALMLALIYWLIFRTTRDQLMRSYCLAALSLMLFSNILNAMLSVMILKVSPW